MSKRYYEAVREILGDVDVDETACAILDVASECDRLASQLADNARYMAGKFSVFATRIEDGLRETPPTAYSTIRDVEVDTARYEARAEELVRLVRITKGQDAVKALRAALAPGRPRCPDCGAVSPFKPQREGCETCRAAATDAAQGAERAAGWDSSP
jgi:hypothetical protein